MNRKTIKIGTRIITMPQAQAIEQAMIEFGVEDPLSRPLHYATTKQSDNLRGQLAVAYIYLLIDHDDPSFFNYSFDAGYLVDVSCELVQPDTFLAMTRFATLLKRGH